MWEDPIVKEVREARLEIEKECGGDFHKIYERALKIFEAKPLPAKDPKGIGGKMGEVVEAGADGFTVVCADGRMKVLRVQPSERVTVITDEGSIEIAAALVRELEQVGAPYHAFMLEELAKRPLTKLPQEILDDLEQTDVSIFAVKVQRNELQSRMQMTEVVNRRKIRHAPTLSLG